MMPRITVLMTVYNGEAYLKECLSSVLDQTYKGFEFLIINDCSTDSSLDIIKSYKDKRMHVIENHKNIGQVKSLNIGLEHSRGEYIARIDQDDLMMENRLERQLDFLNKRPEVAVVGTWGEVIDEKGFTLGKSRLPVRNEEIVGSVLFCGYFLMHPSAMFRKDLVVSVGKYNESLSYSEDFDLWTRLLLKGYRLANIPEFLVKFRHHKKSSSKQFAEERLSNARKAVLNFIKHIDGAFSDPDLNDLSDMLVSAGLMKKAYWLNEANIAHIKKTVVLLGILLKKIPRYFNFTKKESYLMKRTFCNRMLNFTYEASGGAKKNSLPLYLFCLRNYPFLYTRPKLYLYPIKIIL